MGASSSRVEQQEVNTITYKSVTDCIKNIKKQEDRVCARYCYWLLRNNDGKDLQDLKIIVYGRHETISLGSSNNNRVLKIAMGSDGSPVCHLSETVEGLKILRESEESTESDDVTPESESQRHEADPVNFAADIDIQCDPSIGFRHISEAKKRLVADYGLERKRDTASLDYCATFIKEANTETLQNATFAVSCGRGVTVALRAGKGSNFFEFTIDEKGHPIVRDVNGISDGSFKRGACGAPHVQHVREFGYQVISDNDIDRLVSDFKTWGLINRKDEKLIQYVKRVFEKEENEDRKDACPNIKKNVHLTVQCTNFNLVLKAGDCKIVCSVFWDGQKLKYRCKRINFIRKSLETLAMLNFDKILKNVRVGPLTLDLSELGTNEETENETDDAENNRQRSGEADNESDDD